MLLPLETCAQLTKAIPAPRIDEDTGAAIEPDKPLASWEEYYEFRGIKPVSPISLILSFPMTVYHALVLSGLLPASTPASTAPFKPDASPLVVHYIGAATREAALLVTFAEITALLPYTRIRLCMIGPMMPSDVMPLTRFEGGGGGWLEITWHKGDYTLLDLPPADLAVAPNSGIYEYDEWQPCIACLDERRVPFFFTDYSESGLLAAAVSIREAHGLRLSLEPSLNPFRQPMDRGLLVPGVGMSHSFGIPWIGNGFLAALLPE